MHFNIIYYNKYYEGRHNCLWCLIPSAKLRDPLAQRGSFPLRTLETLQSDYGRFTSQGHGFLKYAKDYNNVIGESILEIPLDNVKIIPDKCI